MRFGLNTMIWVRPFTTETIQVLRRIRELGGEVAELTMGEMVPLFNLQQTRDILRDLGLQASMICGVDTSRDLTSDDPQVRANGIAFVRVALETCQQIGAKVLAGPLHAPLRTQKFQTAEQRAARIGRCVNSYHEIAKIAEDTGVDIGIEPLNRFETDFLNTAADGRALVAAIGSPRVGLLLDTFHMNIEERSIGDAIIASKDYIKHFHACENDRGAPGSGHVPWHEVFQSLQKIGYDRFAVIESYNPAIAQLAERVSVWRPFAADQDSLARDGIAFLRRSAESHVLNA
jgi:D-psicose/D-tagatose/L-ribulose 3-epimerase